MSFYDRHPMLLHQHFHIVRIDQEDVKPHIQRICEVLSVPLEDFEDRIFGNTSTVYDFLKQLRLQRGGSLEIDFFIDLVDKRLRAKRFALIALGFLVFSLVGIIALFPQFPFFWSVLSFTLFASSTAPIIGLFYNFGFFLYRLYQSLFDRHKPLGLQVRDNFFLILEFVLRAAGYIVWVILGGMTPFTGGLFVLASLCNVVKSIVSLIQEKWKFETKKLSFGQNTSLLQQNIAIARHEYAAMTERNALLIYFASSILLVGLVVIWSFVPGGIVMPLVCIPILGLIHLGTYLALQKNTEVMQRRLHRKLQDIRLEAKLKNTVESDIEDDRSKDDYHSYTPFFKELEPEPLRAIDNPMFTVLESPTVEPMNEEYRKDPALSPRCER